MACELRHSRERLKQWVQERLASIVSHENGGRLAHGRCWNFMVKKKLRNTLGHWHLFVDWCWSCRGDFGQAFVVIHLGLVYHMSVSQVPKLALLCVTWASWASSLPTFLGGHAPAGARHQASRQVCCRTSTRLSCSTGAESGQAMSRSATFGGWICGCLDPEV